jgi:hypothetical protein
VQVALGYPKEKLPAPVASRIDGLLADGGAAGSICDAAKSFGGLFD